MDNVDNFVYNSNISIFQPFQDVDNFCTIFRVIHIFPHYSTWFVQFAKYPFFSTFFPADCFYFRENFFILEKRVTVLSSQKL